MNDVGVGDMLDKQKQLEVEAKALQAQAVKLSKQTHQWVSMVEDFNRSMKVIH